MKGKKLLALTSIFAGAALVGATFALWAVTDNADPFSVTISPGSISSDTTTTPVTLSYGDRSYANVGNIVNGTKRQAAYVQVTADWDVNENDSSNTATLTGSFSVSLAQTTDATTKLINYLKVYVCNAAPTLSSGTDVSALPAAANIKATINTTDESKTITLPTTITKDDKGDPVPVSYWVVVEYAEASSSVIDQLSDQQVTITMDWNKTGSDVVSSFDTIYYYGPATDVNVYAWKADKSNNGSWPGKDMTLVRDDGTNKLYSYQLPVDNYVAFLLVYDTETKLMDEDVNLASWRSANKPCFVAGTGWDDVQGKPDTLTKDYYLVGTFTSPKWQSKEENGLTVTSDSNVYTITKTLAVGDKFKVVSKDGTGWYSDASIWDAIDDYVTLEGSDMKVIAAGNYVITFWVNSGEGNHIGIAPAA